MLCIFERKFSMAGILDSTCTKDSECSSSIPNSFCDVVPPCNKGQCKCSPPRSGDDCLSLGYGETCETGADKDKCADTRGFACKNTTLMCDCATTGHTYKKAIDRCTDKKLFGETCSDVTDCYIDSNRHSLTGSRSETSLLGNGTDHQRWRISLHTLEGVCSNGKCACDSGFIEETSTPGSQGCRPPFADETGCDNMCLKYPSTASQVAPTCTNNKCSCTASNATLFKAPLGSICVNYCLTEPDSGTSEKDDGAQCSAFNECKSKLCYKCPGDEQTMCYRASCQTTSDGMKTLASGLVLVLSIVLYLYEKL